VQQAAFGALQSCAAGSDTPMRAHASSAGVQEAACKALQKIAFNSAARARLVVSAGALPLVDAALVTHTGHADLQKWGAKLATMLRNA
jgi:hypothetical protein